MTDGLRFGVAYTGKWVAKATVLFSVGMRTHLLLETSGNSVSFGLCVPSVDLTSSSVFLKTNSFGSSLSKSKSTSSIRSRVLSMVPNLRNSKTTPNRNLSYFADKFYCNHIRKSKPE